MPGISQNPSIAGVVLTEQASAPAVPSASKRKLYVGTDGGLRLEDSAGNVSVIASAVVAQDYNLLTNPNLENWQRGAGAFTGSPTYNADRWFVSLGGSSTCSVSRDSTNQDTGSQYCGAFTYVHNANSYNAQYVENYLTLRGRQMTFTARLKGSVASGIRAFISDGVTVSYSSYHTGGGAYETLSVTTTISASATYVLVGFYMYATGTYYFDNAALVNGASSIGATPLHIADEIARCKRYYEVLGASAVGDTFGHGHALSTSRAFVSVAFQEKAAVPTVTRSAASDFRVVYGSGGTGVAGTVSIVNPNRRSCILDLASVTGSPLTLGQSVYADAATTSAAIIIEANP